MSGFVMSPREKMSSIKRFQTVGLKTVLLKLCVSLYAMKMMERKLLSLCSSWYLRFVLTVLAKKIFLTRINLSISRTETRNIRFLHLFLFDKIYKVGSIFKGVTSVILILVVVV